MKILACLFSVVLVADAGAAEPEGKIKNFL